MPCLDKTVPEGMGRMGTERADKVLMIVDGTVLPFPVTATKQLLYCVLTGL